MTKRYLGPPVYIIADEVDNESPWYIKKTAVNIITNINTLMNIYEISEDITILKRVMNLNKKYQKLLKNRAKKMKYKL